MRKQYRLLFLLLYFQATLSHAGAWVQNAGEGLNIFSITRYLSDQYWTSAGRLIASPTYAKNEASNYTEYGITNKFTLGFYVSALQSHTSAMGTQSGVNDTEVLGRYLFWSAGSSVASLQLSIDKLSHGARLNVPPQNSPLNTSESILVGTSGALRNGQQFWFADAALGFVQRYSAGNQLQLNLEAGYKLNHDRVWLMLQNYNTFSLDQINYPQGVGYNLVTVAPSIVYWMTKVVAVQVGMTQDLFGQNVGKGRGVFVSGWVKF